MVPRLGDLGPDGGQGAGRLQFLLGCIAALVVSVALVALSPQGDAPFIAATFVAAAGTLAAFLAIVTEASADRAAAVCAPVAIGLMAFLPGLATRLARLPVGYVTPAAWPKGRRARMPVARRRPPKPAPRSPGRRHRRPGPSRP